MYVSLQTLEISNVCKQKPSGLHLHSACSQSNIVTFEQALVAYQ